jgi:hypothetical protein
VKGQASVKSYNDNKKLLKIQFFCGIFAMFLSVKMDVEKSFAVDLLDCLHKKIV